MDTEFCLGCDKQSSQGAYCSQACRLLDVEKGRRSATTSPSDLHGSSFASTTTTSSSSIWPTKLNTQRFSLPPAFLFTSYTNKPTSPVMTTPESESGYSSKRSSMASINIGTPYKSTGYIDLWKVDHPLSPEAQDQLHLYDSYFIRSSKRSTYYKRSTIS